MIDKDKVSFIPKKSISTKTSRKGTVNIFLFIASVFFVLAIVSSLGVLLRESFLKGSIEQSSTMLEREREKFDIISIRKLTVLDKRLKVSKELLDNHIDLTKLFDILEENTLKNVSFKNFNFLLTDEGADINMDGVARSYSSVALQSDTFGENPFIINSIFSNLDVNNDGDITFSFSASVDKDIVSYRDNF